MNLIVTIAGYIFIVVGVFFILTSVIGIFRLKSFFTRIHAASIIDSLAVPLIIIGLVCLTGLKIFSLKLVMLFIFLFITAPVASHLIAKTAKVYANIPTKEEKGKDG